MQIIVYKIPVPRVGWVFVLLASALLQLESMYSRLPRFSKSCVPRQRENCRAVQQRAPPSGDMPHICSTRVYDADAKILESLSWRIHAGIWRLGPETGCASIATSAYYCICPMSMCTAMLLQLCIYGNDAVRPANASIARWTCGLREYSSFEATFELTVLSARKSSCRTKGAGDVPVLLTWMSSKH